MKDERQPYEVDDVLKICYIAVNIAVEKTLPPYANGEAMQALVRSLVGEAQAIYNITDAKERLSLHLRYNGEPQSWQMVTDKQLTRKQDSLPENPNVPDFFPRLG